MDSLEGMKSCSRMGWVGKTLGTSTGMSSTTSMSSSSLSISGGFDRHQQESSQISLHKENLIRNGDMRWRERFDIIKIGLKGFRRSRRRVIEGMSSPANSFGRESIVGDESIVMSDVARLLQDQIQPSKRFNSGGMNGCLPALIINLIYLSRSIFASRSKED
ncbi:hypothetical protein Tco_0531781 [Tanacetum coccineum]